MSDENGEILRSLGRIEGKLGGIDVRLNQHRDDIDAVEKDVEQLKVQAAKNGVVSGGVAGILGSLGSNKLIEFFRSLGG